MWEPVAPSHFNRVCAVRITGADESHIRAFWRGRPAHVETPGVSAIALIAAVRNLVLAVGLRSGSGVRRDDIPSTLS